jgi:hypothetical protein
MDTDIIDTETSITNVTNSYIELSTSCVHRNMVTKLRSIKFKSVYLLVVTVFLTSAAVVSQQQIKAQNDDDEEGLGEKLGRGLDNLGKSNKQGFAT